MTSEVSGSGGLRVALPPGHPAVAEYPAGSTFGPRTLGDFEFVWLYDGSATWHCRDRVVSLARGVLLLARPGMRDRFEWDHNRASRHGYAHFTVLDRGTLPPPDAWPIVREIAPDGPVPALIRYLLWLVQEPDDSWRERAEEILALLVSLFVRGPLPDSSLTQQFPPQLVAVLEHVRSRWAAGELCTFGLAELAAAGSVSEGHLCRLSRRHFGVGLVSALERLRLDRAKTLLARTNLSVGEVGAICGFASPFHFSRRFSGAYGAPPRSFRRAAEAGDAPAIPPNLVPLARWIWPET